MRTLINNQKNDTSNYFLESILLFLLVTSMLISDWITGAVAISELIMLLMMGILVVIDPGLVRELKVKWAALLTLYLFSHIAVNSVINDEFLVRLALFSYVKVMFYFAFINLMFAYIKKNALEKRVLRSLNIGAVIAILVGLYITIAIATDVNWPYEFIWRFTRTSSFTYEYKGSSDIIRTRSFFSEPAHLGYYLLIVLGMNFFSKVRDKYSIYFQFIIIIGILLTLSYASIGVLIGLIGIKAIQLFRHNDMSAVLHHKQVYLVMLIVVGLTIFLFRDFLYETVIERTRGIIDGTDNSAYNRMITSWTHLERDYFLFGNGIAQSPPLQNIYAYFLTDFGIIGFVSILIATFKIVSMNVGIGVLFLMLNFQKGGYLSPIFSLFILTIAVFVSNRDKKDTLIDIK